jgi:hypothetical protein
MVKDSQKPFDVFSEEVCTPLMWPLHLYVLVEPQLTWCCILQLASADVFLQESQFLLYGNGKDKPPTGLRFDKQQIKGLYFNQSPSKVQSTVLICWWLRSTVASIIMPISVFRGQSVANKS